MLEIQALSFTALLAALLIYQACFLVLLVDCAVLHGRQALQPSMQRDFQSYCFSIRKYAKYFRQDLERCLSHQGCRRSRYPKSRTTPSSSASLDQSDDIEVTTKIARIGPTAFKTANTAGCGAAPVLQSAKLSNFPCSSNF